MAGTFLMIGSVVAGLGVAAGAFGAHALKGVLSSDSLTVYETAARYQMYHALAILMVGALLKNAPQRTLCAAGWCFVIGIVLFSGSLYVMALTQVRWIGATTPLGGVAFIAGWCAFAWSVWRNRNWR